MLGGLSAHHGVLTLEGHRDGKMCKGEWCPQQKHAWLSQ